MATGAVSAVTDSVPDEPAEVGRAGMKHNGVAKKRIARCEGGQSVNDTARGERRRKPPPGSGHSLVMITFMALESAALLKTSYAWGNSLKA